MDTEIFKQTLSSIIEKSNNNYEDLKNAKVRIAISGQSGSGKSSMINAIIGKKVADVGSTETTQKIKSYFHNGLEFADLPGCGTLNFLKKVILKFVN